MTLAEAPLADPSLMSALHEDLEASGWTVDGVRELLGPVAADALDREQAVPALLATAPDTPAGRERAAALLRLFQLGRPVPRAALDRALPRLGSRGLVALGLATAAGEDASDEVRSAVELAPYAAVDAEGALDWWLASDPTEVARAGAGHSGALPAEHVLGVGGASRTLAQITVRSPREAVLDVGTGCGIQALHATRHAGRVVGTDIDARALAFARFNAALNTPDAVVELRRGSMLEPVVGERFDLVVSNPPFVITPRGSGLTEFTYRDGGAAGDDLVRDLVRSVGDLLAPGGVAQLLGNWEHRRGEAWDERVRSWVAGLGLDAWVVQREVQDPAEYAELWLRDGGQTPERSGDAYARAYEAWLADLASRDVEGVGFGFVTLRRPRAGAGADPGAGPGLAPWVRVEEVTGTVRQPLGGAIADVLAAVDAVRGLSDAELLARAWVVAGDVTEERFHTPGEGSPSVILLRSGGGFSRAVRADTALAAFVGASDGELTGAQIVAALAALLEAPADALAAELAPQVRGLVVDGLLLPPGV